MLQLLSTGGTGFICDDTALKCIRPGINWRFWTISAKQSEATEASKSSRLKIQRLESTQSEHTTTADTAVGGAGSTVSTAVIPGIRHGSRPSPRAPEKPILPNQRERERARYRLACVTKTCHANTQPLRLQRQVGNQEAADHPLNRATAFRRIGARSASVRPTACTSSALP